MNKYYISWDDFYSNISDFSAYEPSVIYGVPKGGMIAAGFIAQLHDKFVLTANPGQADIIIDDIIDSGETKKKYEQGYPHAEFIGLYKAEDYDGWLVFPWESDHPAGEESVEDNITRILEYIGEDPSRDGLKDTPARIVRSWETLYGGYGRDPAEVLTVFKSNGYDEIVLLDNIEMYSTCEHHMLPFWGKAHVAYIPDEKLVGISKLARLVEIYARRLQIQERLGDDVVNALMKHLKPKGAACIIEAKHMCICARGIGKQNSVMKTSSLKGAFMDKPEARAELMKLIL